MITVDDSKGCQITQIYISGCVYARDMYDNFKGPQLNTDHDKCKMTLLMTHRGVKLHKSTIITNLS